MDIDCQDIDDIRLIHIKASRVDAAESVVFKDVVRAAAEGGPPRVILEMSAVEFLDSSGLGAVVGVMKMLAPDQSLELAGLTPPVSKVFRMTRMDSIMRIHDAPPPSDPFGAPDRGQAHAF